MRIETKEIKIYNYEDLIKEENKELKENLRYSEAEMNFEYGSADYEDLKILFPSRSTNGHI